MEKCRVCEHYDNHEKYDCKLCKFEWASDYPSFTDDWDLLNVDDEYEWDFLQIQYRLKYKDIDCLQVLTWFDGDVVILIGCNAYADKIARALGVSVESMLQDLDIGITVINVFKERYIRGEL